MDVGDMFDTPDGPVSEVEEDGVFLGARIRIQCAGGARDLDGNLVEPCGAVLEHVIAQFPEGECEIGVVCPVCSERVGVPVTIPVAILVGQEVADNLDDAPGELPAGGADDDAQPFTGAEAADGTGPLRVVTDAGEKIG
jgi:hypothetical protein